ncbi:MAG: hemolysin family protein [Planctomycetota bacterium]|nr:hemolysin family protein [Planctomycetota bacterium]
MLQLVFYVFVNLAGSFFCSLSEAALLSASEARVRARIEAGDRRAIGLLKLKQDPGRTLASIVFLNNIFAIGGTAAITALATEVMPGALEGTGISTAAGMATFIALQTVLIIAFGEITPKVLGEALPEVIASRVAPVLVWVRRVLSPLVWVIECLVSWARPRARVQSGEEAEIRELARLGEEGGHIDPAEAELIRRVFRLDDITAADVMTPRPLIQALRAQASVGDIRDDILGAMHYQFPVYEQDLDHVTGIVTLRDLLAALAKDEMARTVAELQRAPLFLPTSRKVDDVMRDLQADHGGLAVIIDEYGVTEGIITMDDLVEELVGEALDDNDLREGLVRRVSRDSAMVHGLTRVRDVARFLKCPTEFKDLGVEHTTITGLLQDRLMRIPVKGDKVNLDGVLTFEVREADDRTALRVLARHKRESTPKPA